MDWNDWNEMNQLRAACARRGLPYSRVREGVRRGARARAGILDAQMEAQRTPIRDADFDQLLDRCEASIAGAIAWRWR